MKIRFVNLRARIGDTLMRGYVLEIGSPRLAQSATNIDRFVGSWKEDESKAQLDSEAPLIFRRTSAGQLEEVQRGDPQGLPVVFDGKPHVSDPAVGRTVAWTQLNDETFQRLSSDKDGHVYLTRTFRVSPDGRTLTHTNAWSASESGRRMETQVFEREQGSSGLAGTWRMKSFKSDKPQVLRLERTDAGGLRVLYPSGQIANLTLSGQPVALTGPAVLTGTMVASKLMPDGSIEAMQTRNGKPVGHYVYTVSPDGRTMTDTVTRPDENGREPSVYVFVKQ